MDRSVIKSLLGILFFCNSVYTEFCFRKVHGPHPEEAGASVCRGLLEKETFPNPRSCCSSKGAGYYIRLIVYGKRGKKYKCVPCQKESEIFQDLIVGNRTGWTSWGDWTSCSHSCGVGIRTRARICHESVSDSCDDGESLMSEPCSVAAYCPVDGSWGPWTGWTECTKTCSGGNQHRTRVCNDPPPQFGGLDCPGSAEENVTCNSRGCPVDGSWSEWTTDDRCSVTCGVGKIIRTRRCDNPKPENGGAYCYGLENRAERCELQRCPMNGDWSLWSKWTDCDVTCGEGRRIRTRKCNAPPPKYGGLNCTGETTHVETCYSFYPCPIDGGWTSWGDWGQCLAIPCSGERGFRTRTRSCTDPLPQFKGKYCSGNHTEVGDCTNNDLCPMDGTWCEWSQYDECKQSNQGAFKMRTRDCNCPLPTNGGKPCQGEDFQVSSCTKEETKAERPSIKCGKVENGSGYFVYDNMDDEEC